MPKNLFKCGAEWTGNAKGRPPDFRIPITKDIIKLHLQDTKDILQIIINKAKIEQKEWALKLYMTTILPYFLVKPKTEMEITNADGNEILDKINNIPVDKLRAIQQMIAKEMEES